MGHQREGNYILILVVVIVLLIPVYLLHDHYYRLKHTRPTEQAVYVGHESCIACHANEYGLWKGSHHDKAMSHANDSTVLGDFNQTQMVSKDGTVHRFYKRNGKFYVFTDGPNGNMQEFEVKYTFGYTPLQNYLVEFEGGRLQTLALTWNSVDRYWYHMADSVYRNEKIDHTNWLHWTNQSQNWNSMCADCHSTNLVKGYDVATDTYNTTFSEINVSCEACHGPASQHLDWANLPEYSRSGFDNMGLVVHTGNINNKQYVDQCARCHSRRSSFTDYTPSNQSIYNHIIPVLPTEPEYFIDGQILDENYVYASFAQSKMYMHNVKCNDCHNVHSLRRHFEGNKLCLQCHKADDYDTPRHHFHKNKGEAGQAVTSESGVKFEVGSGAECVNCHMPGRYYMGVDYRNDHSFRVPRPDLTIKLGTPNACNQCHNDKSAQWAQGYVEKWHGINQKAHYGETFAMDRDGKLRGFENLKQIIGDELYPEIVRATALAMLGQNYQNNGKALLYGTLQNSNAVLRQAAVRNLNIDNEEDLNRLLPLLYDDVKSVRIEVANKLMPFTAEQIGASYHAAWKSAVEEYFKSLEYNADFPIGKFNLANYYFTTKDYTQAEKLYLAALVQDNSLNVVRVNLAYLYNTTGKPDKAANEFSGYLNSNPHDGDVLFSYGLLLAEMKQYDESLSVLLKAAEASPDNARIYFNLGNMYDLKQDKSNAVLYFKQAILKDPGNSDFYITLLNFYLKNGQTADARAMAKTILERFPDLPNQQQLKQLAN